MLRSPLRTTIVATLALAAAACASAPPPAPPVPTFEEKIAAILRLEDQRVLRDPAPPVTPPPPGGGGRAPAVAPPPPPDLVRMLADDEARIRRRADLAIGRVGLRDGVAPLAARLKDPDPEVRQMAAFALGLVRDPGAIDPLLSALEDEAPMVQASAAEALGLIGDPRAAAAVGNLAVRIVKSGALAETPGPDADARRDLPSSAFRLAVFALVRLDAYEPLAAAVLDAAGQPIVRWWPVAYALQRIEDPRARTALLTLSREPDAYTRAFAAKGLGALKDPSVAPALVALLASSDQAVVIESVRALGRLADASAAEPLVKLVQARETGAHVRLEALDALGAMRAPGVTDLMLDFVADPNPAIRAAALRAAAAVDPEQFVVILSGLDPDPVWSVRAAVAAAFATLPPAIGLPGLTAMLADDDPRVIPAVLDALVKLRPPDLVERLTERLAADDVAVRAAAARGFGELRPPNGERLLAEAYEFGQRDGSYSARAAALDALARYGAAAGPTLRAALADKDWAVRLRAAMLLGELDGSSAADLAQQIRPAPTTMPVAGYGGPQLVNPPVSTAAYIDTDRGTIEIELAVLDAPLTVDNFVRLARTGHFDGMVVHRVVPGFVIQSGDPRGDGEGGPGYTIRDELNERPYLRGTVGMALDLWGDTGGSQFFITHSPQPHLDARYTVFGRVIGGMEVVDTIELGDVIRRVRVWDGTTPPGN